MAKTSTVNRKAAAPLDGLFHYTRRGGTFGDELVAGLTMGILAVCGMFANMQAVGGLLTTSYYDSTAAQVATNGEVLAVLWVTSMIVAVVGTLLMALVARLPLVQVTSLELSCVLVGTVSLHTGLTYYNMLAIVFVADLAYLVVAAVPQLRKFLVAGLPRPVRAALPVAAGLLMVVVAAQLSGVALVQATGVPAYGSATNLGVTNVSLARVPENASYSFLTDLYHPQMLLSALACVLAVATYLLSARKAHHPMGRALLVGTLFFLVTSVLLCAVNWNNMKLSLSVLWARLWMVGAEDAYQLHLGTALANLQLGRVFTQGFDFSGFEAEGGSVALLVTSQVLSYLFLLLADAEATMGAVDNQLAAVRKAEPLGDHGKALLVNAGTNVLAAVLGSSPVAVGAESVAGSRDRARSGLSAAVAALVFLLSAFVWVVPALMATITSYSISFNMYGHYGKVLQLLTCCSFSVADTVMMVVGSLMAVRASAACLRSAEGNPTSATLAPFCATVALTLLASNLAVGVAAGVVANALVQLPAPRRRKGAPASSLAVRLGGVPGLVVAGLSVALLALCFLA